MTPAKLFTVGYEGRTLEGFLAALTAARIELLADVREAPISRKRGFSKSALADALRSAGIDYVHLRVLGCPKPIRDAHKADHDWARYTHDFLAHLRQQGPALETLAGLALARPTAVMCFEADFNRCHRTYVARAIADRAGAVVAHLVGAGVVEEDRKQVV